MATKHVQDGRLIATSPSAIERWDETTAFGCRRAWWFEAVMGLRSPPTESQALGTGIHGCIENHITGVGLHSEWMFKSDAYRLFGAVKPIVDEVIAEGILSVEEAMQLDIDGVIVNGRIDIVKKDGILDWKTSSDIKRYAKTPGQLRTNTQMLLYAKWFENTFNKVPDVVEHVYVQTKGKPLTERVTAKINKGILDVGMDRIISLVDQMKVAASETDVSKLKADLTKCNRCPHVNICPKENKLMSLLNKFKTANAPMPPLIQQTPTVEEFPSILPPDAPKSNPELAADPVPGWSPPLVPTAPDRPARRVTIIDTPVVVKEAVTKIAELGGISGGLIAPETEEKRGRGRPKGSKNKKEFHPGQPTESAKAPFPSPSMEAVIQKSPLFTPHANTLEFNTVTVSHGATINTGNFNSQRVDVTLTAKFTGSEAEAFSQTAQRVRNLLIEEIERVGLNLGDPKLNPNKEK